LKRLLLTIFAILTVDQAIKFWIKLNLRLEEAIPAHGASFFELRFVENPGMAFGWVFPGEGGKIALTAFRIIAVVIISLYLRKLYREKAHRGLQLCVAIVLAGAVGNIIDSLFYGMIFSESTPLLAAELFPADGGYAALMMGKVVDMFHFTVRFPDWFPFIDGRPEIFQPVFNVADTAISVGVAIIIFRQKTFFLLNNTPEEEVEPADLPEEITQSPTTDSESAI
jgi:signal peptidase II